MPRSPRHPLLTLVLAFALVAGAFVVAAAVTIDSVYDIDRDVRDLETNSLPSVEELSNARTDLRQLETAVGALVDARSEARAGVLESVQHIRGDLDRAIASYATTAWYPGERDLYERELVPGIHRMDEDLEGLAARVEGGDETGHQAERVFLSDAAVLDRGLESLVDRNHTESFAATARILQARQRSVRLAVVLEAGACLLAIVATWLAVHAWTTFRRLTERNAELEAARAAELESFAQRVAHDLLNPLASMTFGVGTLARRHPEPETQLTLERMKASLDRSRRMVRAVFDFAKSGARPAPDRRARLAPAVQAAVDEVLSADPEAAPIVNVEPFEDRELACDEAVLGVILGNLLGNAAKFSKGAADKRIVVRAADAPGARVRVEVEDAGPGLPEGFEGKVFEPYVRAPGATQPGLGLGLATVQRMVTTHGGQVGVRRLPAGTAFWFELPVAA